MPSFFEEVDATGVVEEHIKSVLRLEHDEANTILKDYADVRNDLVKRLRRLPPGNFTAQHLRGVLAQVEGAMKAINLQLKEDMIGGAYDSALSGIEDLLGELNTFDSEFLGAVTPINLNAALLAKDTTNLLVTKYQTNLDEYGRGIMQQLTAGLFSATIGDASHEEVTQRIGKFFVAEEWKLRRIVRTELHNIYNMGKINGMQELADDTVPDLMKALMHPMDQRTGKDSIYAATLNLVAEIDEPFSYQWGGRWRVFMAPPDRPNDRSILVPYRREWGKARGGAFVPGTYPKAS